MLEFLIDRYGEGSVLAMTGLVIGLLFGASAQHSRFCLRAASVELSEGTVGPRLSIWLIAFCSGVALVQGSIALGWLDVSESRQLASVGSLSGAIIGGLMFGSGMILARGCASRLLVLSATGNLRALVTGLVLTLVAQASLRGVLAPAREKISTLWLVSGGTSRDILGILELNSGVAAFRDVVYLDVRLQSGSKHKSSNQSRRCSFGCRSCRWARVAADLRDFPGFL